MLPEAPSQSGVSSDARMFAPAAARNAEHICSVVKEIAPSWGNALEIASGTGEHVVHFAENMPAFHWQPSDIDDARLSSIKAWMRQLDASNISDPINLDVTRPLEKGLFSETFSLLVCVNLFHLISDHAVQVAIDNMAELSAAYGGILIYGPFKRGEAYASHNDRDFDKLLRGQDPRIGLKDVEIIRRSLVEATNRKADVINMPANNLALVVRAR